MVEMELELCSCPPGRTAGPLRHQAAVVETFPCFFENTYLPTTPKMRAELFKLTSGGNLRFIETIYMKRSLFDSICCVA